jgi:ABC-2 type transport system permease protein
MMRRGEVLAALVIPPGYEKRLNAGEDATAQMLVDGADGVTANGVLSKTDAIARMETLRRAAAGGVSAAPPLSVQVWTRYNPEGRSALYLVPGLAAFVLAIAAVLLTALTIAGEWERGSMEQLFEVVIGKLLPYLALGMIQLLLVVAVGAGIFDVPLRGSLVLLLFAGLLFLTGMLGQGLLISVITRDQLVATQAGTLSSLLPSLLLSGMLFPIENMPRILQWVAAVVPARYLVHALRGILLKGNGLALLWPDLVGLAAFALLVLTVSVKRFQRRLG